MGGTKILFIAIDSADGDLIRTWAAAGILPAFRSLFEGATFGITSNSPGLFVGSIWASFSTGVSPGRHGRFWFRQLRSGTYQVFRQRPHEMGTPLFWDTLGRAGRRVAIIDVPETPRSDYLNGIQLVDWGTHAPDVAGFCTWPLSLAKEVTARFGRDPVGLCDRRWGGAEALTTLREDLLTRVQRKAELSSHFLAQGRWDFFLTTFTEAHCVGHQYWHLHDPTHPRHDGALARTLGDPIKDVYVAIDAAVGRLVAQAGTEARVFVLCSHGMGPCHGGNFLLDSVLRRLEGAPPAMNEGRWFDALLWCWQHIPQAIRTMAGPLRDAVVRRINLAPLAVDGSRRCFQLPNNDGYGAIRVNLVGREPHGRIAAGAECEEFCTALTNDLLSLVNADTGRPVVQRVLRVADVYRGSALKELPDLLVEWSREAPIVAVSSQKTGRLDGHDPQHRSGDHKPEGLFFASGAGLGAGPLGRPVGIIDFAPTIGSLLGVPLHEVEGTPIAELIKPPSLQE
jgi:predicted AlkP superfamily phosphohydrolase/phosphomutase